MARVMTVRMKRPNHLTSFITEVAQVPISLTHRMRPIFYGRLLPCTNRHGLLALPVLLTTLPVTPTILAIPVHLALLALTIPTIHPVHLALSVRLIGAVAALAEAARLAAGKVSITSLLTIVGLTHVLSLLIVHLLVEYLFNCSKILDT